MSIANLIQGGEVVRLLKSHTPSKNQGNIGEVANVLKNTELIGYQASVSASGNVVLLDRRDEAMNGIRMEILDEATRAKVEGDAVSRRRNGNYQVGVNDRTDALTLTDYAGREVVTAGEWQNFVDTVIVYMGTEALKTPLFLSYLSSILPDTTEATFAISDYTTVNDYTECRVVFTCNGVEMQFAFIVEGFDIKMVNETKGTGASSAFMSSRENFSTSHAQFGVAIRDYFMDRIAELTPDFDLDYINQIIASLGTVAGFVSTFDEGTQTISIKDYRKVYCEDIVNDTYTYNDTAFSISEESLFTADPINLQVKISTLGVIQAIDDCGSIYLETTYYNLGIDLYNLLYSMSFHSVLVFSMYKKIYGEGVNLFVDGDTLVKGAYIYDNSILQQHEDKIFLFVDNQAVLGLEVGTSFDEFVTEARNLVKTRFAGVDIDVVEQDFMDRVGMTNVQIETNGVDANFYADNFVLSIVYDNEKQQYVACSYVKEVLKDEKYFTDLDTYKQAISELSFEASLEFSQVAQEVFQGSFKKVTEFLYEHESNNFSLHFGLGTVELIKEGLMLNGEFTDTASLYEVLKDFRYKIDNQEPVFDFADETDFIEPASEPIVEEEAEVVNEDGTYNAQALTKALSGVVEQFASQFEEADELSLKADKIIEDAEAMKLKFEEKERLRAEQEALDMEEPIEEEPVMEEPMEKPIEEEPVMEEPVMEEPPMEEPIEEEPVMEEPPMEEPMEEPIMEEPIEEEPFEDLGVEEPMDFFTMEEPMLEPTMEEPIEEEPVMEEPIEEPIEEPTEEPMEEPVMEEPTEEVFESEEEPIEESVIEEPSEDFAMEEPVMEEPVVEETVETDVDAIVNEMEELMEEEAILSDEMEKEVLDYNETYERDDCGEKEDKSSGIEDKTNECSDVTSEQECVFNEEEDLTIEEDTTCEEEQEIEPEIVEETTDTEEEVSEQEHIVEQDSTFNIDQSAETTVCEETSKQDDEEEEIVTKELEGVMLDIENFWDEDEAVQEEVVEEAEVVEVPDEVKAIEEGGVTKVVIANLVDDKGVVKAVRFGTNLGVFDMDVKVAKDGGVPIQKVTKRSKLIEVNGIITTNYEKQNRVVVLDVTEYEGACQKLIDALFN